MRTVNAIDSRGKPVPFISPRTEGTQSRQSVGFLKSECIFVTIALFVTEAFLCNGPFGGM